MKKIIAMLLTLSLLVTLYGGAFASVLKLPTQLTTVGAEAFHGDGALDVVELPWGAQSIENRAFADSGLKRIYIPDTVTEIADDAFDGTSAILCCGADTFARRYADAHGLAWEDTGNRYAQEAVDSLEALQEEDFSFTSTQAGKMKLAAFQTLSEKGIENAEALAAIRDYNDAVADANAQIDAYNAEINGVVEALEASEKLVSDMSLTRKGGKLRYQLGKTALVMDEALIESGGALEAVDGEGDAGTLVLRAPNGDQYYLFANDSELHLTRTPPASNGPLASNAATSGGSGEIGRAELALGTLTSVTSVASTWDVALKTSNHAKMQSKLQEVTGKLLLKRARLDALKDSGVSLTNLSKNIDINQKRAAALQSELKSNYATLSRMSKVSAGISGAAGIFQVRKLSARHAKVVEIMRHGHPNAHDTTGTAYDISSELKIRCVQLILLYWSEALFTGLTMGYALTTLVAGTIGTKMTDAALSTLFAAIDALWMDRLYDDVIHMEDLLHTYVYGYVTDAYTHGPVEGASVFTEESDTWHTDKLGYYELYLPYEDAVTVNYTKEGYQSDDDTITLPLGTGTQKDWEMTRDTGVVYGYVYDEATREPLTEVAVTAAGSTIFTAGNGAYELDLPAGVETRISFSHPGYADDYLDVTPVKGQRLQRDKLMNTRAVLYGRITDEETGETLSGVKVQSSVAIAYSDGQGNFEISVPSGDAQVNFTLNLYEKLTANISPSAGERMKQDQKMLGKACTVTGKVTEGFSLNPLYNVMIVGDGVTAYSGGDGKYTIALRPHPQDLVFYLDGHHSQTLSLSPTRGGYLYSQNVTLNPIEEGVPVDEAHFPDEVFRTYISKNFDKNHSKVLTEDEIQKATYIGFGNQYDSTELASVEGIQYFIALKDFSCWNGLLTRLDISGLPALKSVSLNGCEPLQSLSVTDCPSLTSVSCSNCPVLTRVNLDRCENVYLTSNSILTSLDMAGCADCLMLTCSNNALTHLTLPPTLTNLRCGLNQLKELNISACTQLENGDFSSNLFTSLDLSGCTQLKWANCSNNPNCGVIIVPGYEPHYFSNGVNSFYFPEDH